MKKISILLVLITVLLACKEDKPQPEIAIGDFSFSSEYITPGEPFTITYKGTDSISDGLFYHLMNARDYPQDLVFSENTATVTIPDSISAVVFAPKVNEKYAHNDHKGFMFDVKDTEGNTAADAEAAKQLFTFNSGEEVGVDSDNAAIFAAIDNAVKQDISLEDKWMGTHLFMARQIDKETTDKVKEHYLSELESKTDLSEDDYDRLTNVYYATRENTKADSLMKIASEKFPDSEMASRGLERLFFDAKTFEEKEAVFNANKDKLMNSQNKNFFLESLAMYQYREGNTEAFESYVSMIDSKSRVASLYNSIAWPKAEKGEDVEAAMALSKKSLELMKAEQEDLADKPEYYSTNQYKTSLEYGYSMYADTYALLAFKNGDIKEAITFQEQALEKGANAEMYGRYVEFLMSDEQYETIVAKVPEMIEDGNSTSEMKSMLKEAYQKTNPEGDAETMIAELEEKAKKKGLEELKKTLLDEEAPNFTMTNLDGEQVTLSDMEGKTVVLDFWATWCGPCIASFPAMQDVVTKYKDDETVEFFFVDTFESGDKRLDEVQSFITKNEYDFNVLIDPIKEGGSQHIVAQDYKVSGIPTKFIIGPNGNIKFKSVGYNGSPEKTVNEIDAMIELINTLE